MDEALQFYLKRCSGREYWGQYQLTDASLDMVQYRWEEGKIAGTRTYTYKDGIYTTWYGEQKEKRPEIGGDMHLDYATRYTVYLVELRDRTKAKERVMRDFDEELACLKSYSENAVVYYDVYRPFWILAFNVLVFNLKENKGMIHGNNTIVAFEDFFRSGECSLFPSKYGPQDLISNGEFDGGAYNVYINKAYTLLRQYIEYL